jgi:flavorubredoxin
MHGSTKKMVDFFIKLLIDRSIVVKPFNLTVADIGELAMSLVDAATVVIASPTMLVGAHPHAVYAAYLINALRPKIRFYSIIGSYGWGGKMVDQLKDLLGNLKAEFLDPVIALGYPEEKDFKALERLADRIQEKHRKQGITK